MVVVVLEKNVSLICIGICSVFKHVWLVVFNLYCCQRLGPGHSFVTSRN